MAKSEFRVVIETQVNTPESLLTVEKGNGKSIVQGLLALQHGKECSNTP